MDLSANDESIEGMRMDFNKSLQLQAEEPIRAPGTRGRRNSLSDKAGTQPGESVSKEQMIAALENLNNFLTSPGSAASSPEASPGS